MYFKSLLSSGQSLLSINQSVSVGVTDIINHKLYTEVYIVFIFVYFHVILPYLVSTLTSSYFSMIYTSPASLDPIRPSFSVVAGCCRPVMSINESLAVECCIGSWTLLQLTNTAFLIVTMPLFMATMIGCVGASRAATYSVRLDARRVDCAAWLAESRWRWQEGRTSSSSRATSFVRTVFYVAINMRNTFRHHTWIVLQAKG